jgi:hypothetical protein
MGGRISLSPHDVFTPFLRRFSDEHARSLSETRKLYSRVTAAHRQSQWGQQDALGRTSRAILEAVCDRVTFPEYEPLAEAIRRCVYELLALESTIFSRPSVDFSKPLSLKEHVDLNRFLRAQEHFLAHQDRVCELLVSAIGNMTGTVVESSPNLFGSAFCVPLLSLVTDPGKLLDCLTSIFFKNEHFNAGLFAELCERLHDNMCRASGVPSDGSSKKPLIWPSEAKLSPQELADTYLAGTPLQSLLLTPCPFALPDEQRFSGQWVVAPPGRGKTTLLHSMIVQDLSTDASVILIDSKGDLLDPIKRLRGIAERLVLVEADTQHPVALNPLDIPRTGAHHAVSLLEYVFSSLLDAKMTSLQQTLFRSVLPALITVVPNPTLEKFRDFMANGASGYRDYLEQLPPDQRDFFFNKHNGFDSKTYQETRNQLIWRLQLLMSNPVFKAMFAAPKTKLDIGREMDAGKVILISNSKSALGDEGAEFFGRFFIALILAAAQQRSGRAASQKLPCYVYIDECQTVISRDTKIATILDECRSQKIGLILAHQRTEQIKDPDVLGALSNCAIRFANSDDEAKYLSEKLRTSADFLRTLGRGRFGAFVRDVTRRAVAIDVSPVDFSDYEQLRDDEYEAIRRHMREQYGASAVKEPPTEQQPATAPEVPISSGEPPSDAPAAW